MFPSDTELAEAASANDMLAKLPTTPKDEQLAALFGPVEDLSGMLIARARAYLDLRKKKEQLEEDAKKAGEAFRNAESELLRAMSSSGVPSISIDDGGQTAKLCKTESVYYALPAKWQDDPALRQSLLDWIGERGGIDLLKESIHHSTFSSFCKELVDAAAREGFAGGKSIINPLHPKVQVTERRVIQLRKG